MLNTNCLLNYEDYESDSDDHFYEGGNIIDQKLPVSEIEDT